MKEDVTDIILNLKGLVVSSEEDEPVTMYVRKQAGHRDRRRHRAPAGVTVHNPDLHIATLNDKGKLEIELVVERGCGYVPAVQNKASGAEIGCIPVDSIYSPVLKVTTRSRPPVSSSAPTSIGSCSTSRPRTRSARAMRWRRRARPSSSCSGWPASSTWRPRASRSGRRRRGRSHPVVQPADRGTRADRPVVQLPQARRVHTVGELVARTESDLLDIRNFGQKSIDEVKGAHARSVAQRTAWPASTRRRSPATTRPPALVGRRHVQRRRRRGFRRDRTAVADSSEL